MTERLALMVIFRILIKKQHIFKHILIYCLITVKCVNAHPGTQGLS